MLSVLHKIVCFVLSGGVLLSDLGWGGALLLSGLVLGSALIQF